MLSFSTKYLIQKCLTGAMLIFLGCANRVLLIEQGWLFYLVVAFYALGMLWSLIKKSEPEDERAIKNIRKAKSHAYNLFVILILVNAVISRWNGGTFGLSGEGVLIIFGVLQFAEYIYFRNFEKGVSYE